MAKEKRGGTRDKEKEKIWRATIKRWQSSGKSQAQFCRDEGLNENTFSSWKKVILERDAESVAVARMQRNREEPASRVQVEAAPAFIRFAISDGQENQADAENLPRSGSEVAEQNIAAEFIDAGRGRRVRIYKGADQASVNALLAVLSAL